MNSGAGSRRLDAQSRTMKSSPSIQSHPSPIRRPRYHYPSPLRHKTLPTQWYNLQPTPPGQERRESLEETSQCALMPPSPTVSSRVANRFIDTRHESPINGTRCTAGVMLVGYVVIAGYSYVGKDVSRWPSFVAAAHVLTGPSTSKALSLPASPPPPHRLRPLIIISLHLSQPP